MPTAQVGAATINYEMSGEGPLVVLLHEIGGTLETWTAVAALLEPRFRVLRYDQRGAGKSSRIAGAFSLDTQVEDIGALLEALALREPCHIAGVAIGAAFATCFAARHPELVRSLVLACPAPGVDAARIDYLKARAAAVEHDGMAAAVENTLANSYPPEVRRDRLPPIGRASSPTTRAATPGSIVPSRISTLHRICRRSDARLWCSPARTTDCGRRPSCAASPGRYPTHAMPRSTAVT